MMDFNILIQFSPNQVMLLLVYINFFYIVILFPLIFFWVFLKIFLNFMSLDS